MRSVPVPVAALVLAASLAACGGGEEDRTAVYFIDGYRSDLGMRGHLVARERSLQQPGLGRIVAEVLRGPTAAERDERGLITGFSPGVRVSTVALANGTARIRLSSARPPRRWPDEFYATAQLVYTLTGLVDVQRVVLTVNGTRCCVYDMRQRPWMRPLTRALFAHWQGAPADE
jgi:spore germination protein GerM